MISITKPAAKKHQASLPLSTGGSKDSFSDVTFHAELDSNSISDGGFDDIVGLVCTNVVLAGVVVVTAAIVIVWCSVLYPEK